MSLPPVEILPAGFLGGLDLPQRGLPAFLPDAMGEYQGAVGSEKSEKPMEPYGRCPSFLYHAQ
jgi:hypothetical protein